MACPERTVLLIDGDSSFNMTLNDLGTVKEHQLPIKMVRAVDMIWLDPSDSPSESTATKSNGPRECPVDSERSPHVAGHHERRAATDGARVAKALF